MNSVTILAGIGCLLFDFLVWVFCRFYYFERSTSQENLGVTMQMRISGYNEKQTNNVNSRKHFMKYRIRMFIIFMAIFGILLILEGIFIGL